MSGGRRVRWGAGVLAVAAGMLVNAATYDVILRGGTLYDGSGEPGRVADVAWRGDTIEAVGTLGAGGGREELEVTGLAIAPGFINMLSWACAPLMADGRAESDVRQGVTLEVMGEGESFGPLNARMKRDLQEGQKDIHYEVNWTTLGEYLERLEQRGVSPNVASFVGASTVRIHELGYANRAPWAEELRRMEGLVEQAMKEGAMGVASALIYAPGCYASTSELVALSRVAARHGGMYITHLRSEGVQLLAGVDECLAIAREAGLPAEIYHLKAAGAAHWPKLEEALRRIEAARASGLRVTANMYVYTAAGTGLNATLPPWVQEGGFAATVARLRQPAVREKVLREMRQPAVGWENFLEGVGLAERIVLTGFRNPQFRRWVGRTLTEVAVEWGKSPEETILDLVIEDGSRVDAVFFLMSEDDVRRLVRLPWVSLGSDEGAFRPDGVFVRAHPHPRAYGNFARFLGRYVRDERLVELSEAIRRLTRLPASNLGIERRGSLAPGCFADVVVFDPGQIQDHATYDRPHQFATGVKHVWVNGVQVVRDGAHTGATPGRVVRGPGYQRPGRGVR